MSEAYQTVKTKHGLIKAWVNGVPVEDAAWGQVTNVANMPFVFKHIAAMPDIHAGKGSTVGCVIPTIGAIIPAAVGVDLSCGVNAQRLTITNKDLGDQHHEVRTAIERAVPHGRTDNGGRGDVGAWGEAPPDIVTDRWMGQLVDRYEVICGTDPLLRHERAMGQLGTLGTGNHFIEVCTDETGALWVVLHSGSRGAGNKIGSYFTNVAKKLMKQYFIELADPDLAYLAQGTPEFDHYIRALHWAQDYALYNRRIMMALTLAAISKVVGPLSKDLLDGDPVECHHNFTAIERHFGQQVMVTRKGAVRAQTDDLCIIPGSMAAPTYIARGLGNRESFNSCSHGAGRAMSRTAAKKRFTVDDLNAQMGNIESRRDEDVIDEIPAAYKSIDLVMNAQKDLVEVVHTLRQVINVKG